MNPHIYQPTNIVEVDTMLNDLTDFFNSSNQRIYVGGICGSPLLRTVLDATTTYTKFDRVLVVDGCPDLVYMKDPKHAVANHIYFRNLMVDKTDSDVFTYDPFSIKQPVVNKPAFRYLNIDYMNMYEVLILNNANLMDEIFINSVMSHYCGKIVVVVDPFEYGAEQYVDVPTIIRSFHKLPPIVGMARAIYNVETDMIHKQHKGGVYQTNIRRNSIGVLGNQMYVSEDEVLIKNIRSRQDMSSIHKNHKFVITDNRVMMCTDENNIAHHLSKDDIVIAGQQNQNNARQPFRIFKSDKWVYMNLVKDVPCDHPFAIDGVGIHQTRALPANIVNMNTMVRHRFNTTYFIQTDGFITTQRMMYTLMKNSVSLHICKVKS